MNSHPNITGFVLKDFQAMVAPKIGRT